MKIIDSAMRLGPGQTAVSDLLKEMDRCGIVHAVVAPEDAMVAVDNETGNTQMADLMTRYPGRLSGLAVANPWYGPAAVRMLEEAFARGLCGLYIHPGRQGFRLTEPIVQPLLETCRKHGKPVYSHTGTPVCAEPFQLAELARQFPDVTFVMGHAGYSDFWYDVAAALKQAPNLLVETSCQVTGVFQAVLDAVGPERLLFGSGWPRSMPAVEIEKIATMNLRPEVWERIMRANALAVWRITP